MQNFFHKAKSWINQSIKFLIYQSIKTFKSQKFKAHVQISNPDS